MSSLRKYQKDPIAILNNALQMYRSKEVRTTIVEGASDKRFLSQWIYTNTPIRFDGLNGKPLVDRVYIASQKNPYCDYDFLYFLADIDFDVITGRKLNSHPNFIYNSFCFTENRLHYNDLEAFLINTSALNKILVNLDIDTNEADSLRERLERASRITGSLRAADIIVQKEHDLRSSILNGLDIRAFFNPRDISFEKEELLKALPRWSNYREHTEDLIETADRLNRESPSIWSLSRGHDLTEMLSLHLEFRGHKGMSAEKLELMLRLACELSEFHRSPMGKQPSYLGINMPASNECKG